MPESEGQFQGVDLTGLGKLAKAIPPEVYKRTTATALSTFEKLVAPVTETTSGFGRYIRQKFNRMVAVEKALATYTMKNAVTRFRAQHGDRAPTVNHPKSFVRSLVEASNETDPLLNELWANLLATQMAGGAHPNHVALLNSLSPADAAVLITLPKYRRRVESAKDYNLKGTGADGLQLPDTYMTLNHIELCYLYELQPAGRTSTNPLPVSYHACLSPAAHAFRAAIGYPAEGPSRS